MEKIDYSYRETFVVYTVTDGVFSVRGKFESLLEANDFRDKLLEDGIEIVFIKLPN